MGGVDRMDQNIACYRISIRSRKRWWPLLAYLLDVAMQNSWIIYRQTDGARHHPLDQLEFRREACNTYYKVYAADRPSFGCSVGRLNTWMWGHLLRFVQITWIISLRQSNTASMCSLWNKGQETVFKVQCWSAFGYMLCCISPQIIKQYRQTKTRTGFARVCHSFFLDVTTELLF